MKQIYLIRHAKSSWADESCSDFDRTLSSRGKRDVVVIGNRLAAAGVQPELIISSPARRARKTARAIATQIKYPKDAVILLDELYTFDGDNLPAVLHAVDDNISRLALVGHNEAISDFAEWLLGRSLGSVPTCAVVALSAARERWGEIGSGDAELIFYDYPKRDPSRGVQS